MHGKVWLVCLAILVLLGLAACGGGGETPDPVTITSINLSPTVVAAGSIIALTATLDTAGADPSAIVKNWSVSEGTLTPNQPDFALLLRGVAQGNATSSLSTTAGTIYWVAPTEATSAIVSLEAGDDSLNRNVVVGSSPVVMSIGDGSNGAKVVTVQTSNIDDLYQAAFRINHSTNWQPSGVEPGTFLGDPAETGEDTEVLWLGLTNQDGFVPFAITRVGDLPGVDGDGVLARITFQPNSSASAIRETSAPDFDLAYITLVNSVNRPIDLD